MVMNKLGVIVVILVLVRASLRSKNLLSSFFLRNESWVILMLREKLYLSVVEVWIFIFFMLFNVVMRLVWKLLKIFLNVSLFSVVSSRVRADVIFSWFVIFDLNLLLELKILCRMMSFL